MDEECCEEGVDLDVVLPPPFLSCPCEEGVEKMEGKEVDVMEGPGVLDLCGVKVVVFVMLAMDSADKV